MCSNTTSLLLFQSCVKNVYLQTVFLIICEKGWLRWKNSGRGYEVQEVSLSCSAFLPDLIAPLVSKDNSQQLLGYGGERYVGFHFQVPVSSLNETFGRVYNGSCTLVRHMGEILTRQSQEVKTAQKFSGNVLKDQETLAKDSVQHVINIKNTSHSINFAHPTQQTLNLLVTQNLPRRGNQKE